MGRHWWLWTGKHFSDYLVKESRRRFLVRTVHGSVVSRRDESRASQHRSDHQRYD